MKKITICHHFGLGDHFTCNGLVRELIEREKADKAFLTVNYRNIDTVKAMYSDEPRLSFIPVLNTGNQEIEHFIRNVPNLKDSEFFIIGFDKTKLNYDVGFYEQVGIPFEKRWSSFKCPRDKNAESYLEKMLNIREDEPFILVQDYDSLFKRDYKVDTDMRVVYLREYQYENGNRVRLTDWCGIIEKAKEVHALSSLVHLTASMGIPGIYHDYCRDSNWGASIQLPSNWNTVVHC